MFKKTYRIPHNLFSVFFKKGVRINTKNFILIWLNHDKTLVSVVVGKKVSQSAVIRNKIKRRVLSIVKNLLALNNHKNIALIVIVKNNYVNLTKKESEKALQFILRKLFN